ncbi:MAG: hypothetical protein AABN34_14795 [Acidobacteriota bacterium]
MSHCEDSTAFLRGVAFVEVALTGVRILFLCAAAALLFVATPPASGQQPEETIPFETIVKYVTAGPFEQGNLVIYVVTDRREWKRVWKLAHITFPARPPLPEIDFTTRMVLAVFHHYTGGSCTTSIAKIAKTEDGLQIFVRETCPGASCGPQPANVSKPLEIVEIEGLGKSIRKKVPDLIVDHRAVECEPRNQAGH